MPTGRAAHWLDSASSPEGTRRRRIASQRDRQGRNQKRRMNSSIFLWSTKREKHWTVCGPGDSFADGPASLGFLGHRIVMKMNQRSRGGVYEQGEGTSFGSTGWAPDERRDGRGRWSAKSNFAAGLRLLRREDLETLSRELGATAATLSGWRDLLVPGGRRG